MPSWFEDPAGVLLTLHVLPNAPKSQIIGVHGKALKVKIHAPPVDGKANDEIIRFFSKELGIAKNRVQIISGNLSKSKRIRIEGLTWSEVKEKLKLD
jgi:hypothetical protein